jgi:hypothetical protein
MREIVRRAVQARPELTAELLRRGMFRADEKAELLRCLPASKRKVKTLALGPVQFASALADADAQFAARAVLRHMLDATELSWLDRLLKFQKLNKKGEELTRVVERAMEGRKGNARR